jgi:hypothetical protein
MLSMLAQARLSLMQSMPAQAVLSPMLSMAPVNLSSILSMTVLEDADMLSRQYLVRRLHSKSQQQDPQMDLDNLGYPG